MNLSVATINQVLQYLSGRPYAEVAGIIAAIQQEAIAQQDNRTEPTDNATST